MSMRCEREDKAVGEGHNGELVTLDSLLSDSQCLEGEKWLSEGVLKKEERVQRRV